MLPSLDVHPLLMRVYLNLSFHCLDACLSPYKDLINLHTLFSCLDIMNPFG